MRGARPERALDAIVRGALRNDAGARVLVACSGGPDSLALASVIDRLPLQLCAGVVLGHVNHGRRPSADQDECVVLAAGARLSRPVVIARPAIARDDEQSLRDARYRSLADLARAAGCSVVVTAHTAEDQTETVLLALFRGTGNAGMAGIPARRPLDAGGDVTLVRPVLRVTHAELAVELRRRGLAYAIDPTNTDARYRRNFLRERLDGMRTEFPHLDRAVARYAAIVADERDDPQAAHDRRRVRFRLRAGGALRDVSFTGVEELRRMLGDEEPPQ